MPEKTYPNDETLAKIFMKRKKEIINPTRVQIASKKDPVWSRIAKDLDNKITPLTVRSKAYVLPKLITREKGRKGSLKLEITKPAYIPINGTKCHKNVKVSPQTVMSVFMKRLNEVVRPKKTFLVSVKNPIWTSMAAELGNVVTPKKLHALASTNKKLKKFMTPLIARTEENIENIVKQEHNNDKPKNSTDGTIAADAELPEMKLTKMIYSLVADVKHNARLSRKILGELRYMQANLNNAKLIQKNSETNPKQHSTHRSQKEKKSIAGKSKLNT